MSKGKLHGGKVERNPGTDWSSGPAGFLRHLGSLEPLGSLGPSGPVNWGKFTPSTISLRLIWQSMVEKQDPG